MDSKRIDRLIEKAVGAPGGITVLTGAGISAESGIPTFRGPEGYWTVGSHVYQPQDMATLNMFRQNPMEVWQWYLYRMGVCSRAAPNSGHLALVEMESLFPERFTLVTQNVDNLHLRAGNRLKNTFQIHGNIFYLRCSEECRSNVDPIPEGVYPKDKNDLITPAEWGLLHCPNCGGLLRPHVLWFDETYNERHYHLESTLKVARKTGLLIVAGTSGATNLPNQVVWEVYHHNGIIIDINIETNPFGRLADSYPNGASIQKPGSMALQWLTERLKVILAGERQITSKVKNNRFMI